MYEGQWRPFESAISGLKLLLADQLERDGKGPFELADCEVKSNWVRMRTGREKRSPFLHALHQDNLTDLTEAYFRQVVKRNTVIMSSVIDKRYLNSSVTHETLHTTAYEFLLESIQHYMREYHPKHRALVVMDDTSRQLNRVVAMRHASLQRVGNQNMKFPAIVEYPFFTRSELSNGVQLADLLAYNVYRVFRNEDFSYPYFRRKFRAILKLRLAFHPSAAMGCGGFGPFFRLQDVSMHSSPYCDIFTCINDFSYDIRYPCSSMSSPTATRGPRS